MKELLLIVFVALSAGCQRHLDETVVATTQVTISSSPAEAAVRVDGKEVGTTPLSILLEKNRDHILCIGKEGFVPQFVTVYKQLSDALLDKYILESGGYLYVNLDEMFDNNKKTGVFNHLSPTCVGVTLDPVSSKKG